MLRAKGLRFLLAFALVPGLAGCGQGGAQDQDRQAVSTAPQSIDAIVEQAKKEGTLSTVGMPDDYANLKEVWTGFEKKYGIKHLDTDLNSAEQIAKMESEKSKATADMGQVGIAFGPIAAAKGITQPYKTGYWDQIPDWAKDKDGHWMLAYTGTIAILTNKKQVSQPPKSWDDLLKGNYKVTVGDVTKSAQSQMAVLAAAFAFGGDENNVKPGIDFFAKLAKQGRLSKVDMKFTNVEKGEIEVALLWDFNALQYRSQIDPERFDVAIPAEGSVGGGDATIINKYAAHPQAAMLARDYILSDEGQTAFANGFVRPIRQNVKLPDEVAKKLLPSEQYKSVKTIKDYGRLEQLAKEMPALWQDNVLVYVK